MINKLSVEVCLTTSQQISTFITGFQQVSTEISKVFFYIY